MIPYEWLYSEGLGVITGAPCSVSVDFAVPACIGTAAVYGA